MFAVGGPRGVNSLTEGALVSAFFRLVWVVWGLVASPAPSTLRLCRAEPRSVVVPVAVEALAELSLSIVLLCALWGAVHGNSFSYDTSIRSFRRVEFNHQCVGGLPRLSLTEPSGPSNASFLNSLRVFFPELCDQCTLIDCICSGRDA